MYRLLVSVVLFFSLCGCITNEEPKIYATKCWEGHYYSVEEFRNNTKDMKLDKGVSVWVISNVTLKRVLKNTEK